MMHRMLTHWRSECRDLSMECNHNSISSRLLQLLWYIGGTPPVLREPRYKTKHSHSIQDCTKSNPKNTNITEVNSKLTLIKSNIEVSEPTQRRSSMPSGRSFKPSLVLLALCVIVSPWPVVGAGASCQPWQEEVPSSDLVVVASVVSRSRPQQGSYSATFHSESILHVSMVTLACFMQTLPHPPNTQGFRISFGFIFCSLKHFPMNRNFSFLTHNLVLTSDCTWQDIFSSASNIFWWSWNIFALHLLSMRVDRLGSGVQQQKLLLC